MDTKLSPADLNLPLGFRFDPTGFDLLQHYLIPKLKGEKLPSNYVIDLDDIYNYEPCQLILFNQFKHAKENEAFFFTMESRKNSVGESQIRKTPNGYWKVYEENVPVEDIGFETELVFYGARGNKTDWRMIEYRCHPNRIPTSSSNANNCIICKIKLMKNEENEILMEIVSEDENGRINGGNFRPQIE